MTDAQVITLLQLQTMHVSLLLEIRDLVKAALANSEPDPDHEFLSGCQHPDDSRVDLSTPGDVGHWICKECRFDNKATA